MFLSYLWFYPLYYIAVVVIVMASLCVQKYVQAKVACPELTPGLLKQYRQFDKTAWIIFLCIGITWAPTPQPVNADENNPQRVALAGPATNGLLLLVFTLLAALLRLFPGQILAWPISVVELIAFLNALLLVLNLIPLPPFEGYTLLQGRFEGVRTWGEYWQTPGRFWRYPTLKTALLLVLLDPLLRLLAVLVMTIPVMLWDVVWGGLVP